MSSPFTPAQLTNGEVIYKGQPYIGNTYSNTDLNKVDTVYQGQPYVVDQNNGTTSPTSKARILSFIWGL